jgi:hypothetical protein
MCLSSLYAGIMIDTDGTFLVKAQSRLYMCLVYKVSISPVACY